MQDVGVFHDGEVTVQRMAGTEGFSRSAGASFIKDRISKEHKLLLQNLPIAYDRCGLLIRHRQYLRSIADNGSWQHFNYCSILVIFQCIIVLCPVGYIGHTRY